MSHIDKIVSLIHEHENLIDYNYNGVKDLIIIQDILFKKITTLVSIVADTDISKEDLIKKSVRTALKLNNQELIIIKKESIVIKILENIKRNKIDEANPTAANRNNGYSTEEIEDLYYEYFDPESLDEFIQELSLDVFKYLFVRKQVTNNFYEKNVYPIIQKIIISKLEDFDVDDDLKKGFSGYILRINFLEVFTYIGEDILESISNRDEYLMNWIKYYHGQIFVDGNKRYQAPYLINSDGQKYNPSAIFGTISMWYKTKEKVASIKKRLYDAKEKASVLRIDDLSPKEYKLELIKERQEVEKDISDINSDIEELMKERQSTKDNDAKLDINECIKNLRQELRDYKMELEEIINEIDSIDTATSRGLEENIIRLEKNLKNQESAIKQNTKLFSSIKSALIKALTSKRKPIDK